MSYDGITTAAVVQEISTEILGGRISKINQPTPHEILLQIHRGKNHRLLLNAGNNAPRICLIENVPKNPLTAPNFCMLLRKHLQGGIITKIQQHKLDRVVLIDISTYDELGDPVVKTLSIEIMGKYSNIILFEGEDRKIIDSIKRITLDISRVRQVLPGSLYEILEDHKVNLLNQDLLPSALRDKSPAGTKIYKYLYMSYTGLSPLSSRMILYHGNLDPERTIGTLVDSDWQQLDDAFTWFRGLVRSGSFEPSLLYDLSGKSVSGFYVFPVAHLGGITKAFPTVSSLIEYYYGLNQSDDRLSQRRSNLRKALQTRISRLANKLTASRQALKESEDRDQYRVFGDLISANVHRIARGSKQIELENFYSETMEPITIPLDVKKTPWENAQSNYKKYSKLKKAHGLLKREIPQLEEELQYLNQVLETIDHVGEEDELDEIREELQRGGYLRILRTDAKKKSKRKPSQPLQYRTEEGLLVYVGRNNQQNDRLTLKEAGKSDYFLHAKGISGSHVILKTEGREPSESSIYDAAFLAAKYSSLKLEDSVPVDYTEKKNVYKAKGSKPGMVYYNDFKTIQVDLQDAKRSERLESTRQ